MSFSHDNSLLNCESRQPQTEFIRLGVTMLERAAFSAYKDMCVNLIPNSLNLISTQDSTLGTVCRLEF